jgi:hypothetical protein
MQTAGKTISPYCLLVIVVCGGAAGRAQTRPQPVRAQGVATQPASEHGADDVTSITVAQLGERIATLKDVRDAEAAQQLEELALAERLSGEELAGLKARLAGAKAQQALLAMADASTFLSLPAAGIPDMPTPSQDEQQRIRAQALVYLANAIPRLPNVFATQNTTFFQRVPASHSALEQQWRRTGNSSARVFYREGKDVQEAATNKRKIGLVTGGLFGPILQMVMRDGGPTFAWDHWERSGSEPIAVFRYAVPEAISHYSVSYRGLSASFRATYLGAEQEITGYRGTIAIDPATGTILRLTLLADLNADSPFVVSDVMVEYGPVEIAGKAYICPLHSVSLATERTEITIAGRDPSQGTVLEGSEKETVPGPNLIKLNDVEFADYHVFRAEVRMLPAEDVSPAPQQ